MSWESELIEEYLRERVGLMKSRWLTFNSWLNRSKEKTRYGEIEVLIDKEVDFNNRWVGKVCRILSSKKSYTLVSSSLILHISTHSKKHRERGVYIAIFGTLVAVVLKLQAPDIVLSLYLVVVAFLVAGERILTSNVITALEELELIVNEAEKHNNLSQKDAASGASA